MRLSSSIASLDIIFAALACLLVSKLIAHKRRIPKGLRLPPGPPRKPIIGNVLDMPRRCYWETFDRWAKGYGDLVYITALGQSMIFVNSLDVAHDLFEKRSTIYSDRIHSPMVHDLIRWDWNIAIMPYGDWWRKHRRIIHQYFHPNAVVNYHGIQTKQSRLFLLRLHESPADFVAHIRYLSGAIIMEIVYGIKVLSKGDPYIEIAETGIRGASEALVPGKYLVEFLPFLKHVPEWMPGARFRQVASEARKAISDMLEMPFTAAKTSFDAGTMQPSIIATLLEDLLHQKDAPTDQETMIRNVTGVAYAAGADTTVSVLTTFILAMVLYPEVQRKAQAELDSIIGNRLPIFEDLESLPYVNAVCKEAFRWHPAFPVGIPHRVMEDDIYGDYFIPKGSIVMGNAWTMLHNETIYGPNTSAFEPERFFRPGVIDPVGQFGFGRRICPGRYMAETSILIAIASVLKVFDISPAQDDDGKEIPVKAAFESGIIVHAEKFCCTIKPRSELAQALLNSVATELEDQQT